MTHRRRISLRLRFEVLAAAGFRCEYCGRRPPEAVLQVDHRIPVSRGGTNDRSNLVASCTACNLGKHDKPLPSVLWEPVRPELWQVIPGRCPQEHHSGPYVESGYVAAEVGAVRTLVCQGCMRIVASQRIGAVA